MEWYRLQLKLAIPPRERNVNVLMRGSGHDFLAERSVGNVIPQKISLRHNAGQGEVGLQNSLHEVFPRRSE